jgi:hypothetical protein
MKGLTLVLLVILIFPTTSMGKRKIAQAEIEALSKEVYNKLVKCPIKYPQLKTESTFNEYLACVNEFLDPGLNESLKQKIAQWLHFTKNHKELVMCPKDIFRLYPLTSERNISVRCFEYNEHNETKKGIIYFSTENDILVKGFQFI